MRIFLIHGMGRTSISFLLLAQRLRARGYPTSSFNYLVSAQSIDEIVDRFIEHVETNRASDQEDYAIVGHSLGGIITRQAGTRLPAGWRGCVMLAPPNRLPLAARFMAERLPPMWRLLTRDAGVRLRDPDFYAALPRPPVPTLVIAGNAGPRAAWMPFAGAPNDGAVSVEETLLDGAECIEVPAIHTFLMNRRDVFEKIVDFLAKLAP